MLTSLAIRRIVASAALKEKIQQRLVAKELEEITVKSVDEQKSMITVTVTMNNIEGGEEKERSACNGIEAS